MVVKMAGYVKMRMSRLDNETVEKVLYYLGTDPINEAGAMKEVLYYVSKNPKHLALAKLFDRVWFVNPHSENIDILSGLHSNTHIELVSGRTMIKYN